MVRADNKKTNYSDPLCRSSAPLTAGRAPRYDEAEEVNLPDAKQGLHPLLAYPHFETFINSMDVIENDEVLQVLYGFDYHSQMVVRHPDYRLADVAYLAWASRVFFEAASNIAVRRIAAKYQTQFTLNFQERYHECPEDEMSKIAWHVFRGQFEYGDMPIKCIEGVNSLSIQGGVSTIVFLGTTITVRDGNGAKYVKEILLNRGGMGIRDLVALVDTDPNGKPVIIPEESTQAVAYENADDRIRYINGLTETIAGRKEERAYADLPRQHEIDIEVEKLESKLEELQLYRQKKMAGGAERERVRIVVAISRFKNKLEKIPEARAFLDHIKNHISGFTYAPPPNVEWLR